MYYTIMPPAYKMVFVNIAATIALALAICVYKYILKKEIKPLALLVLISILPLISMTRPGVYESGDFVIHVQRSISFYASLAEGNMFPSWAGEVNGGYGLPLFIFNYTLPYYFISLIHFLGASFIDSMKIFLALTYILSGVFMYKFSHKLFRNELAAFTSSIFYLFVPYHLIDMHFKTVIGEHIAFTILPILFFCILKIKEENNKLIWVICTALSFAALINSHVFIALMTTFVALIFALFYLKRPFLIVLTFLGLFIGSILSAYIWLTPFFMSQYTIIQKVKLNFIPLENIHTLFYAPWRLGLLFQGPNGQIAYIIGYTQFFVVLYLTYKLINKKIDSKIRKPIILWLLIFFFFLVYILPYAKPLWEIIPFIKAVGQQRLLLMISFVTSVVAGYYVLAVKDKKFVYLIILITIGYTILNWGNRRTIPEITDNIITKNLPVSPDTHFYATPVWVNPNNQWYSRVPENRAEIVQGKGRVTDIERSSTRHVYKINAESPIVLQENTVFFPGWRADINGKSIEVNPDRNGLIRAKLPKGDNLVNFSYRDIPILIILKSLSLLGIGISVMYIFISISITSRKS